MMSTITYGVSLFLFLALAVIGFSGCANVNQQGQSQEVSVNPQSQEVKTFFVAGKEADFRALQSPTSGSVDLSAYSHLMEIKYPPTFQVDVLRKPPSRPYQSFAVLEFEPAPHSRAEEAVERLKGKAREIGADAIILSSSGPDPGIPPRGKMRAVAIKYIVTSRPTKKNNS